MRRSCSWAFCSAATALLLAETEAESAPLGLGTFFVCCRCRCRLRCCCFALSLFSSASVCVCAVRIIVVVVAAAVVFFIVAFQMFMQLHTDMHVHACVCAPVCAYLCLSSNGLQLKSPTKPHTQKPQLDFFFSSPQTRSLPAPYVCVWVCFFTSPSLSLPLFLSLPRSTHFRALAHSLHLSSAIIVLLLTQFPALGALHWPSRFRCRGGEKREGRGTTVAVRGARFGFHSCWSAYSMPRSHNPS